MTIADGDTTLSAEPEGARIRIWISKEGQLIAGPTFSANSIRAFADHLHTLARSTT